MDAKTTVEGVEVSTLHWIGGERVGSADAFADLSPSLRRRGVPGVGGRRGAGLPRLAGRGAHPHRPLEVIGGFYRSVGMSWDGGTLPDPGH